MRRRLEEHRIRGRVWVALGILAGVGAVYVNGAIETRNEVREAQRVSIARAMTQTATPPPYGGGPQPTVSYATPNVAAEEQAAAPTRTTSTRTEETEAPRTAVTATTVAAPVEDGGAPPPIEDAAAPPTEDAGVVEDTGPGVAEDTGPEADAMAQVIAAAAEAGVIIDPNVPYLTPVYATPIPAGAEPFPAQSFPEPTGAGGTAAVPSVDMTGGTPIGAAGAGGIGLAPNVTMAGGTSIGAAGAGGGTEGPSVTNAGGVPVGNAGATILNPPATIPFGATVPFGGVPFASPVSPFMTPVSPFMTPVSPFMAPQGFAPFMMNPYSYFIYVPPIGAWGAQ